MTIRIFATGGTFDKEYNERDGSLTFQETHVSEMLRKGRCRVPVDVRTLMMVDSLEMDDDDRNLLLTNCRKCPHDRIVITHGTDTLEVTARALGPEISDKTVVLVGAMIPYTFGSSDGLFNLGAAIAFAQTLPPGVYVAMNGRVFDWDNVRKNRDIGEFTELR
jgi:L-asparaginase